MVKYSFVQAIQGERVKTEQNKSFPSCFLPVSKRVLVHNLPCRNGLIARQLTCKKNLFPLGRLCTKTSFETDVKSNLNRPQIDHFSLGSLLPHISKRCDEALENSWFQIFKYLHPHERIIFRSRKKQFSRNDHVGYIKWKTNLPS